MNKYDIIYEELQERVDCGELTLEAAELINDRAYEKYVLEDGHSKNLKKKHWAEKRKNEEKFKKDLNYEYNHTNSDGDEMGTVHMKDGKKVNITIKKNSR